MSKDSLNQLFGNAYPCGTPSESARRRVTDAALLHDHRTQRRALRARGLRFAFTATLAIALTGTFVVLMPKKATAAFIDQLTDAMDGARNVHMTAWTITADGERRKSREMWHEAGKWRIDSPSRQEVLIHDGQKQWTYLPHEKTVYTELKPEGPFTNRQSGWNMSALIADHGKLGGFNSVTISDVGSQQKAVLMDGREHMRVTLLFDKKTSLPSYVEQEAMTAKGWRKKTELRFAFNTSMPSATFSPVFPKGTSVVDLTVAEAEWQKKFTGEIGRMEKGNDPIIFRDMQVTSEGHVFVLYTSKSGWQRNLELTDTLGTVYAVEEGSFQPYIGDAAGNHVHGFTIDGRRLEGMWFIPIEPVVRPWAARTLTLTHIDIKHVVPPAIQKQLKDGTYPHKTVNLGQMEEVRTVVGSWSIEIKRPTSPMIPPYMRFMANGPRDEFDVRHDETGARWRYYFKAGDFPKAIAQLKERVRLVEEWEEERNEDRINTQDYMQLYLLLRSEGRRKEGLVWLRKAANEPQGGGGEDPNLERVLREEGIK
jgi:outer membrane lipoprotein-sorting protein